MGHVFPVGVHQDLAERRGLANLYIEKVDIEGLAFGDLILPTASLDNCVSHKRFRGEKAAQSSTGAAAWQAKGKSGSARASCAGDGALAIANFSVRRYCRKGAAMDGQDGTSAFAQENRPEASLGSARFQRVVTGILPGTVWYCA